MAGGKFDALFNMVKTKVKDKVKEKGGVKGLLSAWENARNDDEQQQTYKGVAQPEEGDKDEKPKKDNKMFIYLGLGAIVLFMLMKKK